MIEIKPNKLVAFIFDAIKISVFFVVIFFSAKMIYGYILDYIRFMIVNNMTAELSPLVFLMSIINGVFQNFYYDLAIALIFTYMYSLNDKYVFDKGFIYAHEGWVFSKDREVPYKNIREIDFEKTIFDVGNIIIRLHEEQKPIIIPNVSKVMETCEIIKKETGFEKDERKNNN